MTKIVRPLKNRQLTDEEKGRERMSKYAKFTNEWKKEKTNTNERNFQSWHWICGQANKFCRKIVFSQEFYRYQQTNIAIRKKKLSGSAIYCQTLGRRIESRCPLESLLVALNWGIQYHVRAILKEHWLHWICIGISWLELPLIIEKIWD